ncbi:MAG: ABC transporter permease [Actinomycetota bacterium]
MKPEEREPPVPETGEADESDLHLQSPMVKRAAKGSDGFFEAATQEEFEEAERLHRAIPRVRPRVTEDLDLEPPPRTRYPLSLRAALAELVHRWEIVLTFVERDLRVRYKQAALGAVWAVLQPLTLMVIFSVVFGRIAQVGSEGLPYPIFSYTALVPWSLFSSAVTTGTSSIITNAPIIRKIYMPREIFPASSVLSSGVDFGVSTVILFGMLIAYGFSPQVEWIAYPLILLILTMFSLAVTLVFSAVTVYFRDTRYGIPLLLQIALFATPVAYPLAKMIGPEGVLHGSLADAYVYLNPLAPIMDGFRRILAHGEWPLWGPLGSAAAVSTVGLGLAYWWYKRIDRTFADVI